MKSRPNSSGFTLVELSIVFILVGLIIGAILKGQELLMNARVTSTIAQERQIKTAYDSFRKIYKAIPGDMADATDRLTDCDTASFCADGDGDDWVGPHRTGPGPAEAHGEVPSDIGSESVQFWKHLALAGLLEGLNGHADTAEFGKSHPAADLGGGFHVRSATAFPAAGTTTLNGLVAVLRRRIDGNNDCSVSLTADTENCEVSPAAAFRIDEKMDDGIAQRGMVQAVSPLWMNGCGAPNAGINGPSGYKTDAFTPICDVMFSLEK